MRRPRGVAAALAASMLAGALGLGCGVKSEPVPPEYAVPKRIVDLRAASRRGGIQLIWARPDQYAGGAKMRDLGQFEVFRAEGRNAYRMLAGIPVTDQERFQQQRRFTYLDRTAQVGGAYRYEVFSETLDGYRSQASNEVEVTRLKLGPAPNPETFVLPTPTPAPTP